MIGACGKENEVGVVTASRLELQAQTQRCAQRPLTFLTGVKTHQLAQGLAVILLLIGVALYRDAAAAVGDELLLKCICHPLSPVAFRNKHQGTGFSLRHGMERRLTGFVFGGESPLIKITGRRFAGIEMIQSQYGDRGLAELCNRRDIFLTQRADDEACAFVERSLVSAAQRFCCVAAVVNAHHGWGSAREAGGNEPIANGLGTGGERPGIRQ